MPDGDVAVMQLHKNIFFADWILNFNWKIIFTAEPRLSRLNRQKRGVENEYLDSSYIK